MSFELSFVDVAIIYATGVFTHPIWRIGMKTFVIMGHAASIATFAQENPRKMRWFGFAVLIALIISVLTMSGCASHHAMTPNDEGAVDSGAFKHVCLEERDEKLLAFEAFMTCSPKEFFFFDLNAEMCAKAKMKYNQKLADHKACLKQERPKTFSLNPNQSI